MKLILVCVLLFGVIVSSSFGLKCYVCTYLEGSEEVEFLQDTLPCKSEPAEKMVKTCDATNSDLALPDSISIVPVPSEKEHLKKSTKGIKEPKYYCSQHKISLNGKFYVIHRNCAKDVSKDGLESKCGTESYVRSGQDYEVTSCLCSEDNCNGSSNILIGPITLCLTVIVYIF